MTDRPVPTPDDVRAIVALDGDPILRNLRITQGYWDLSQGLHARIAGPDMSWTTLGAWASKTAGQFIRSDEVPKAFKVLLDAHGPLAHVEEKLGLTNVVALVAGIVGDVSTNIMVGNRVVFEEIAGCCASFMQDLAGDNEPSQAKLDAFLAAYEDGDPEPDEATWDNGVLIPQQRGGQGMLKDMCRSLYAAMFEPDRKKRAELMLLANGYGGLHEQTRLQTYIAGSLNAPVEDLLMGKVHEQLDHEATRTLANTLLRPVAKMLEEAWHDFATLTMMELTLPDGVLHLGRPIPPDPDGPLVPPDLETIENEALRAVLKKYDALEIEVDESFVHKLEDRFASLIGLGHRPSDYQAIAVGATDWVEFDQRMRYILTLFRMRAQDPHLFEPTFTDEQLVAIDAGRVPPGPL